MKRLLRLIPILALIIALSACRSSATKIVQKRNKTCGTELRIPDKVREAKPVNVQGKPHVQAEPFIALLYHASDLSACLRQTQCVLAIRERELECAEENIDNMRGSVLPGALQIRRKCQVKLQCIDDIMKE